MALAREFQLASRVDSAMEQTQLPIQRARSTDHLIVDNLNGVHVQLAAHNRGEDLRVLNFG